MLTSYKFWYIKRDDDGFITECAVRFYEGEINTRDELKNYVLVPITRYRRSRRLQKADLSHLEKNTIKELTGDDCILYTDKDFGKIKTNADLVLFLNKELAKDGTRTPIDEQK